jgi:hypothetical protein
MLSTAGARPPALTMATTNASTVQAVTSSVAAQARAVLPRAVLVRPRSSRMRASTGKAVMLIEMPMKSANARESSAGRREAGEEPERGQHAQQIREEDADLADEYGGAGLQFQLGDVQFHADDEHEEADADLAEHAQGAEGSRRKDHLEEAGPKPAHQRGAEQDAGDHFTYDGRLPRFAHQAAANAGSQDDKNELHEQTVSGSSKFWRRLARSEAEGPTPELGCRARGVIRDE